jgi:hypothetical protein
VPIISSISLDGGLYGSLRQNQTIERYLADLLQPIRSFGSQAGSLTQADVDLQRAKDRAEMRANMVAQVLRSDLNGDGIVTRAEALASARPGEGSPRTVDSLFDRFDLNGDGSISLAEITEVAAVTTGNGYQTPRLEALLALDPNHDGRLTAEELTALGRRAFAEIDTDGDGIISPAEYAAYEPKRRVHQEADRREQAERVGPTCRMPPAPAGTGIFAVGLYEGQALSNVAVGGTKQETNYAVIHIEPGKAPLYVVLASYESMVWKFDGDVRRVAQVAATSVIRVGGNPAIGVVGIKADRVSFLRGDCLRYFTDAKSIDALSVRGVLHRSLGHAPEGMVGAYGAQSVGLPSGLAQQADRKAKPPLPKGFDPGAWDEVARYWPAGLANVDPRGVVSKAPVQAYDILPSQAGISQLVGNGSMVRAGDAFKLVRPIAHFPGAMFGAHSERLIIARGVPVPSGERGHNCIVMEDGSAPPAGAACH